MTLPSSPFVRRRWREETSSDDLHLAVLTGRTKKIKQLLKKGVHIESVNPIGQTPLFCASFGGDYEVVDLLLRLGANPNRRCGSKGAAPIHAASYRGSRRVLRLLVEAGGNLCLRDSEQRTPRDYAEKQPSPLRRQKILEFYDLLYSMTLHRPPTAVLPMPPTGGFSDRMSSTNSLRFSEFGSMKGPMLRSFFGGSQMSLMRRTSQSTASIWSSCVSDAASSCASSDELESRQTKEVILTPNLHKNLSCHLLDQLCVTTSLPLLTPDQLKRPPSPSPAYTCGGPTVYSCFSWLETPVTVRRPTPALSFNKGDKLKVADYDGGVPDEDAVRSLLQELSFLRRLRHPGFLEVMAACHVTHPLPDHVTLVYQRIQNGSLYHFLHVQHRDLSLGGAVDILVGLVEALMFMHAHGWFHCGLSSHAIHLVSTSSAKLGGFEYALETQVKGVSFRAAHLSKATWLMPWQASETILDKMVSTKSEVYSLAAVLWELWSGMPPWAGIEEEELSKRVGSGERLPALRGASSSLVAYLTEYGLKWDSHERELDLQEVHTMLRSLRIQCNEEERIPAITSWGPPSVPNTPVIGRHSSTLDDTLPMSSSGELRLSEKLSLSIAEGNVAERKWFPQKCAFSGDQNRLLTDPKTTKKCCVKPGGDDKPQKLLCKQFSLMNKREQVKPQSKKPPELLLKSEGSRDSGFSTPGSRTPTPTSDNARDSVRNPTILTSTPVEGDPKLDLLPSKLSLTTFISTHSPDLLRPKFLQVDKGVGTDFSYIKNYAKRTFLEEGATQIPPSEADEAVNNLLLSKRRQIDVIKRGLSLTNLCSASVASTTTTIFTRTTSHISLSSHSSSSSGETFSRKPARTVSQITLTMRKLSGNSSSSSISREDLMEKGCDVNNDPLVKPPSSGDQTKDKNTQLVKKRSSDARRMDSHEIIGIKPASHQVTRHSSNCSLGSAPSSPEHQNSITAYPKLASTKLLRGSLPTSPTHPGLPTLEGTMADSKTSLRTQRYRARKSRRKHDVEVEEHFIDDEFNSLLYDQPHMQLSIGSSENLLDNRHSFTLVEDSASSSLSNGVCSRTVTSSEEDVKDASHRKVTFSVRQLLKELEETVDSDSTGPQLGAPSKPPRARIPYESDSDDIFVRHSSCGSDGLREYEPLKSPKVLNSLEKSLTNYLPKYSIGSDSD